MLRDQDTEYRPDRNATRLRYEARLQVWTRLYRNNSVPDLQALLRNANEKLSAALEPTLARLTVAFSAGFVLKVKQTIFLITQHISLIP
jgi:hypothetical protein